MIVGCGLSLLIFVVCCMFGCYSLVVVCLLMCAFRWSLLLVRRSALPVVCCIVSCLMLVIRCVVLVFVDGCALCAARCMLFARCWLLFVDCYSMYGVCYCLLSDGCCCWLLCALCAVCW